MTPQIIQKIFIPKNKITENHKTNEIQKFRRKKMTRAYVYMKITKSPLGTAGSVFEVSYPRLMESWTENVFYSMGLKGAQWLSGRVLDSRPRVRASPASLRSVLKQERQS